MQLSQKERSFLEDQKKHEELCIKKYNSYANQARDPQLKQMFQTHAQHEQQHLDSINQILAGQVPSMGGQQQQQQQQQFQSPNLGQVGMVNQQDADLCQDMLDTEKYISHLLPDNGGYNSNPSTHFVYNLYKHMSNHYASLAASQQFFL
jgi:spore coat protein CotF